MADAASRKQNRSSEELDMRVLIEQKLRERWHSARIIHELPLRYSTNRIDMAAIGTEEIVGVEIKSSRDVADRLEPQIRAFAPVTTRMIIALAPKWNPALPLEPQPRRGGGIHYHQPLTPVQEIIQRVAPPHCEVWTVCATTGEVTRPNLGGFQPQWDIWPAKLLDMLHVAELQDAAARHPNACWPGSTHAHARKACLSVMTTPQALRAACRALRARAAFAAGTDPPIVESAGLDLAQPEAANA